MRRPVRVLAAGCALALLAGCGSGSDLSDRASALLKADAAAIAKTARAGDSTGLRAALTRLSQDVATQLGKGELSADRAARILSAAKDVAADAPAPAVAVTPRPTPKPTVTRSPAPRRTSTTTPERKKHGKGKHDDD